MNGGRTETVYIVYIQVTENGKARVKITRKSKLNIDSWGHRLPDGDGIVYYKSFRDPMKALNFQKKLKALRKGELKKFLAF